MTFPFHFAPAMTPEEQLEMHTDRFLRIDLSYRFKDNRKVLAEGKLPTHLWYRFWSKLAQLMELGAEEGSLVRP